MLHIIFYNISTKLNKFYSLIFLSESTNFREDVHCRQLLIGHLTFLRQFYKYKSVIKNACFDKQTKALQRLCKLFHLKMTCTFCIDNVRVKVPSFQKVTQFLQYKIFHRDIIRLNVCLFEVIPNCHDFEKNKLQKFCFNRNLHFFHVIP